MTRFPAGFTLSDIDGSTGFTLSGIGGDLGSAVAFVGDVNGDGIDDLVAGARRGGSDGNGAIQLVLGGSGSISGRTSSFFVTHPDLDQTGFGASVAGLGDINGDGIDDFIVGARSWRIDYGGDGLNDPGNDLPVGAAFVVYGGSDVTSVSFGSLGSDGFTIVGDDPFGRAGQSVAGIGDVNGDGYNDILIGAYRDGAADFRDNGAAYIVYGSASRPNDPLAQGDFTGQGVDLADNDGVRVTRVAASVANETEWFGFSVASAGDVNGDGLDDLIIGEPGGGFNGTPGGSVLGGAYVVFGRTGGFGSDFDILSLDGTNGFALEGGRSLGSVVSGVGDVNGDGFDDVLVSSDRLSSYLVFGGAAPFGASIDVDEIPADMGLALGYATSASPMGDIDGDGYDDFILGTGSYYSTGQVRLYYGGPSGIGGVTYLSGPEDDSGFGLSVAGGGDINGDGVPDVAVGAPALNGWSGAVYGLFGPREAVVPITGTADPDTLTGTADRDSIEGRSGNDTIFGLAGDDTLNGGGGDDWLNGGAGGDHFEGGAGRDTVSYESATGSVRVDLQDAGYMFGDAVGDTFANVEIFRTGDTVDRLRGDGADNIFYSGGLSDRLYGRQGDDKLFGGDGADAFYGGMGADTMTGGDQEGRRDRYIYFNIAESGVGAGNRDVITDFVSGEDRIEIRRFDADVTQGFKQYFTFVGDAGLSGAAGELAYVHRGSNTIVQADVDGDGLADFEIGLAGIIDLTEEDFLI